MKIVSRDFHMNTNEIEATLSNNHEIFQVIII